MQLNTIVLIIGVIGFSFGIGALIYTLLIKNKDSFDSLRDDVRNLIEGNDANRANFDTLRSANLRANRMDDLFLNSHQKIIDDHSVIVNEVPESVERLSSGQEELSSSVGLLSDNVERVITDMTTKEDTTALNSQIYHFVNEYKEDVRRSEAKITILESNIAENKQLGESLGDAIYKLAEMINNTNNTMQQFEIAVMKKFEEF